MAGAASERFLPWLQGGCGDAAAWQPGGRLRPCSCAELIIIPLLSEKHCEMPMLCSTVPLPLVPAPLMFCLLSFDVN